MSTNIKLLVEKQYEEVVALRRYFHTYPEVSGQECNTQRKILEELVALGLNPHKAAGTGVVAEIKGGYPGKTVALRADMDALLLQDECAQPYRSQNIGVCHACGHDGHIAMLLGAAKVLYALRKHLSGNVRLLFQPSEETFTGGACDLIAEGELAGVETIVGAHLWQSLPFGKIGISYGRMMAAPDEFSITIQGHGGHASMPQQTVDPIMTGVEVVQALNTIICRNIDPLEPALLSIGCFKAGEVYNIIPDTAVIKGTVRSFEEQVRQQIFYNIERKVQGICAAAGAEYNIIKKIGYGPVINDPAVTAVVAQAGCATLGEDCLLEIKPVMGGEDFSCYQEKIPGAFFFVGIGDTDKGIYPNHHPKFDMNEQALAYGMEVMVRAAINILEGFATSSK